MHPGRALQLEIAGVQDFARLFVPICLRGRYLFFSLLIFAILSHSPVAHIPRAKLLESSCMAALLHLQTSVLATKWKVTSLSSRPPLTEALTIQAMVTWTR